MDIYDAVYELECVKDDIDFLCDEEVNEKKLKKLLKAVRDLERVLDFFEKYIKYRNKRRKRGR